MMGDDDEMDVELTAEQVKTQANAAYKLKDYKEAYTLYSQAIELDSTNATYYSNRAAAQTMLKDFNGAINDCRRAIMIDNLFIKAYSRVAKCYVSIGNVSEAVVRLASAEQLCMTTPSLAASLSMIQREIDSLMTTANELLDKSEFLDALTALEQTFTLIEPSIKRFGSGSSKFKATELTNLPIPFRVMRCQLLVKCREFTEASIDVHKILLEQRRNPDALVLQAHIGYITDSYTLAQIQQLLSNAIGYDPDNKRARIVTRGIKALELLRSEGNAAFAAGDWEASDRIYTSCIEADTDYGIFSVKALSNRATVRSKSNQHEAVIADCEQAIKALEQILFPQSSDISAADMQLSQHASLFYKLYLRRADIYMKQEKYEECVRDYQTADGIKPGDHSLKHTLQQAQKLLKMSKRKDYYKLLGVDKDANDVDLKRAFRKLALLYHPDKQAGLTQEEKDISEQKFKDVKEAYDVLTDPQKREMFDQGHDVDGTSASGGGGGHHHGGADMQDMMNMFFQQQQQGGRGGGGHSHGFGGQQGGFSFDF